MKGTVAHEIQNDFTDEIHRSLERNRPIIARVAGSHGRFRVFIGVDGDTLIEPDYSGAQNLSAKSIPYEEIQKLYIIGDKIPRRFTEKDGLERIAKIMEANERDGLWDEYRKKMGWYGSIQSDAMEHIPPEKRAARMKRTADTMWYTFNSYNFAEVFRQRITDTLKQSEYDEIQRIINPTFGYTHDLAWALIGWNDVTDWIKPHEGIVIGFAEAVQLIIGRIEQNDREVPAAVEQVLKKME